MNYCNYCVNKKQCNECEKGWKDKFIPPENIKSYFQRVYCGKNSGIGGMRYSVDTTSRSLKPTHKINIYGRNYCPYCCTEMIPIQHHRTLSVIGYFCLCQGALDELEYNEKKAELEKKHEEEITELKNQYAKKLTFDRTELLRIKHEKELEKIKDVYHEYSHFSTYNGESISKADQLL